MGATQVLVLFNEPVLPTSHPDAESEHQILSAVEFVTTSLLDAGFAVTRLGVSHDPGPLCDRLRTRRPDVVFNLFEGTADRGDTEAHVAGLLEWLDVPFTGSPAQALCLARGKHLTKRLLRGAGLPTPDFFVVEEAPVTTQPIPWPVIVKPSGEDGSVGIDQGSVVTSRDQFDERVDSLLRRYGPPVLVEEFVPGREFSVRLVETPDLHILPVSEVRFAEAGFARWPILTYEAKWSLGSREDKATPVGYPEDIPAVLVERLGMLACQAFRLLGCRDYASVDFRVRPSGEPHLLEVNPNPDLRPTEDLARALAAAGLSHAHFIVQRVHAALARATASPRRGPLPTFCRLHDGEDSM